MLNGRFLEVRVDATINKGNYESEKVGVTYAPEENEDIFVCINACRDIVYGTSSASTGKVETSVKETKAATTKAKATTKDETAKEEVKKDDKKSEKEAEKAAKAEEKAATKAAAKITVYDRENGLHKKKLASVLTEQYPSWKTDESLKKNALSASQTLHEAKTPFIDGDLEKGGQVVQEFLDKLKEIMEG